MVAAAFVSPGGVLIGFEIGKGIVMLINGARKNANRTIRFTDLADEHQNPIEAPTEVPTWSQTKL